MPRTPLAWPTFQPTCLKEIALIFWYLFLIAVRFFAMVIVSVAFVLRLRQIWHITFHSLDHVERSRGGKEISKCLPTGPIGDSAQRTKKKAIGTAHSLFFHIAMATSFLATCVILVSFHFRLVMTIHDNYHSRELPLLQTKSLSGLKEVFQLYQPMNFAPESTIGGCDVEMILMDHIFGSSYGKPFVGTYVPPSCVFDTVHINFTVTSKGRQYDRLASLYLGDAEVFRTSTAEPTSTGIVWTYIKDLSAYNALWKEPQIIIFDLGNIISDVYTGSFNATLTAHFSYQDNTRTADRILPISGRKSALNMASAFSVPTDNTTVSYEIPSSVSRAVVGISACGQSEEEFWWSNVFSQDVDSFDTTVGKLYGHSPFREIQLYIDGVLSGVVWPFPIIFTGGVAPGFWRPIVGTDAFDLRQSEIDISPFLPLLQDGKHHSFEIRVTGLTILPSGSAVLADTVGSYWVVSGNVFLYDDEKTHSVNEYSGEDYAFQVDAPVPSFTFTRQLKKDTTGGNDTLEYSITAERVFSASSPKYSWSQSLSFSNHGFFNQQGYSQVNKQLTSGRSTISELGENGHSNDTSFRYPLLVNSTYGESKDLITIDAWMKRGLEIDSSGNFGISLYTMASGPSHLRTSQSGKARYKSVSGSGGSFSLGNTADDYERTVNGETYSRSVRAVNGEIVYDTSPVHDVLEESRGLGSCGRDSVRSMLGRGPGNS